MKQGLIYFHIFSFFVPFSCIGIIFILNGIYPFGKNTILMKDMFGQYLHYYYNYYDIFKGDKNFFYSWEAGLGTNFLGLVGYYLSSFFSPVILLFEREYLPEALAFLVLVKSGFMGLFMSFYVRYALGASKLEIVVFSSVYATMSYVVIYFLNIMWMDALIYLPLIVLGVERLVHKKKTMLLIISLALLFISNFYVAFMVGLFVFFYFLAKVIQEIKTGAETIRLFSLFMVSTFIAAGLSAFLLLPTYLALNETVNKIEIVPNWEFIFPPLQLVEKFFFGSYSSIVNGIPNIYVGTFPLLLICIFLFIKGITYKEKLVFLSIFFLFLFSFEVPVLNLIWHAFDQPNLYPYRYAFLFSFVLVYLSYRVFQNLQKAEAPKLIAAYLFLVAVAILVQKQEFSVMTEQALMINLIFLTLFLILLLLKVYHLSNTVSVLLLFLLLVDMTANGYLMLKYVQGESPMITRQAFLKGNQIEAVSQQLSEFDSSIYRAEAEEELFRKNGPLRYDFKGFKHFSSMIDQDTVKAMDSLGYTTYYDKWYTNKGGTLVSDALLGLKYFMKETPNMDRFNYAEVKEIVDANYTVYENYSALPIGYYVKDAPASVKNEDNPFYYQNRILQQMVGTDAAYFNAISIREERHENLEVVEKDGSTILDKVNEEKQGMIQYTIDITEKQQLYLMAILKDDQSQSVTVFVNGRELGEYPTIYNKGTLDLGLYEDEKVTVTLLLNSTTFSFTEFGFYGLNTALYSSAIKTLKQEPMKFTNWTSRTFNASISTEENGHVFLSIPYDRGWLVKVDDVKVKPKIAVGGFMLIPIQEGTHKISMSYVPPGFKQGLLISIVSCFVFIGFQFFTRKRYAGE